MYLLLSAQLMSDLWLPLLSSLTHLGLGLWYWADGLQFTWCLILHWTTTTSCACVMAEAGGSRERKEVHRIPWGGDSKLAQCHLHCILLAKTSHKAISKKVTKDWRGLKCCWEDSMDIGRPPITAINAINLLL